MINHSKILMPFAALLIFASVMAINEALTKSDIETASEVLGIDFLDDDDLELSLPGLERHRETLLPLGQTPINTGLSPP